MLVWLLILLFLAGPAQAQQHQSAPPDPVTMAYQLGLRTGQEIAATLQAADDKLKWVLDNWVPKQPEGAK